MTIRNAFLLIAVASSTIINLNSYSQLKPLKWSNDELYVIGKSWGLIKYYHPAVSHGKVNWDSVLIASVNLKAKVPVARLISDWFTMIDKIPVDKRPEPSIMPCDSADLRNFDVKWIQKSSLLSVAAKTKLSALISNDNIGVFYTIGTSDRYSGKNEARYPDKNMAAYRLLSLFRFWNVIEYFYPYKYGTDNWDNALQKFIPSALSASNPPAYAKFLAILSASLKDSHASVDPEIDSILFGKLGPPFKFRVIDVSVVVTKIVDPAVCTNGNIGLGDVINSINGKKIAAIINENTRYVAASNNAVAVRDAYQYLFNGNSTEVTVSGNRKSGEPFNVTIPRIERRYTTEWDRTGAPENPLLYLDQATQKLVYSKQLPGNIFYVDRSSIENKDADALISEMKKNKALIFDLRGYFDGNALAMIKIFDFLLAKSSPFAIKTRPDFTHPGKFCFVNYVNSQLKTLGKENANAYKGKVVVLINEDTQSAEEFFAMMFKTIPNVVFVGSQTAGADGNMTPIPLADNHTITMSGFGVFYPDYSETQRIGIKPDIVIKPTIKDIQNGRDTLLEEAIRQIKSKN